MKKIEGNSLYLVKKYTVYFFEAIVAAIVFSFFRLMPMSWASETAGFTARFIGPHLSLHRKACQNISRAMPELKPEEVDGVAREMWDNLGRTIGEYPHIARFNVYASQSPVTIKGEKWIDRLRDGGKVGIFITCHTGNWEIIPLCITQRGLPLDIVYREPNNPLVKWLVKLGRSSTGGKLIPKGPKGVPAILKSIKLKRHVGMLVDQKMNDGIPVPFFGIEAMTAPAVAQLAIKYDCPIIPGRIIRMKGTRFLLEVFPPFEIVNTGNRKADVAETMYRINLLFESWIREYPEQWLWVHNRWPDQE